ncbi:MAG: CHAT domain-containing protein [Cyanobacteriota bacterium]|nr:CHAT domain-containing protein [Cyanobacteriota bacterium]
MNQYFYHIIVPNESTVRVRKLTPQSANKEQLTGKLNLAKINDKIREIIIVPDNLEGGKITKVGEALFEALFDSQLREDFLVYYQEVVKRQQQILAVILEINEEAMPEMVAYPWELMCLPQKYNQGEISLATDRKLNFYRCRYQLEESDKLSIKINEGEKLKIALVVSKPTADNQLSNVEYREVQQYLKRVDSQQEQVEFLPVMDALNFYDIVERLEADKPDIFHFIGHGQLVDKEGEDVGQVALVNELGEADWKDARMFGQLFSGNTPKIVILQACETGKQSETNAFCSVASRLMLQGIPVVVAMQYKVSNQTAISFVKEFYAKIIEGNSVEIGVQKARFKLGIENGYDKRDFAIPVVYMNALDGHLFLKESNEKKNSFLNLTDAQKRKLREDIETVLSEDKLRTILFEYEDKFGRNFYNQIPGGDYRTRLIYLIRELKNRQLIDDFIEVVRYEYPNFAQDL